MFVGPLLPSGRARFLQRVVAGLSIAGSIGWTCTGRTYTHAATYAVFVAALRYCNTIWVYYALASWESQTPANRSEIQLRTSVLGAYGCGAWESNPVSQGYEPRMIIRFHSPATCGTFRVPDGPMGLVHLTISQLVLIGASSNVDSDA